MQGQHVVSTNDATPAVAPIVIEQTNTVVSTAQEPKSEAPVVDGPGVKDRA